jgi:phage tail sheath protein FI
MAKAKNIYPCFKCGLWFSTVGEQKAHTCGVATAEPKAVEAEVNEKIDAEVVVTPDETNSKVEEDADFNREEAIQALKNADIIKDKRAVSKKSDEEVAEMLKAIEA